MVVDLMLELQELKVQIQFFQQLQVLVEELVLVMVLQQLLVDQVVGDLVEVLRPLVLRDVANDIGMHESTVSRVTNEKFVQTPRGVLPLKFFFSAGLATSDGDDVSARGIKDQLQKLVSGEDTKNPLTDQAIVEILQQTGVQIARRTVAKYRDQLGVLPARMRKRV